jgi:AcrR family transcriptional regulator
VTTGQNTLGDHRVRAAHTKRVRTRAQILDAVLAAYPGSESEGPATVDAVLEKAKLSRATFYKYFTSLEQAVEELGSQLADELAVSYASIYREMEDPKERAATGFQLFLSRAAIEPNWGSFVSHAYNLNRDQGLLKQITQDLRAGIDSNDFVINDLDIAVDLVIGIKIEAIRQLKHKQQPRRYIEGITSMMLRSLCVSPDHADLATRRASDALHREAPTTLPWWSPF